MYTCMCISTYVPSYVCMYVRTNIDTSMYRHMSYHYDCDYFAIHIFLPMYVYMYSYLLIYEYCICTSLFQKHPCSASWVDEGSRPAQFLVISAHTYLPCQVSATILFPFARTWTFMSQFCTGIAQPPCTATGMISRYARLVQELSSQHPQASTSPEPKNTNSKRNRI